MLMQMRASMEAHSLRWNSEKKKYELPFDPAELAAYNFVASPYLGQPRVCVPKSPEKTIDQLTAQRLAEMKRLQEDFALDPSEEIVGRVNQVLSFGSVTVCTHSLLSPHARNSASNTMC